MRAFAPVDSAAVREDGYPKAGEHLLRIVTRGRAVRDPGHDHGCIALPGQQGEERTVVELVAPGDDDVEVHVCE